jgi:hypothetical protein
MEEEEVFRRVKKVVATQLNVEQDRVTMEANFTGDLSVDELDMVELVINCTALPAVVISLASSSGISIPNSSSRAITSEAIRVLTQSGL